MKTIFLLEEVPEWEGPFFVGIYSTEDKALAKIEEILEERFKHREMSEAYYYKEEARDDFRISEYIIDEGFVTEDLKCEKN